MESFTMSFRPIPSAPTTPTFNNEGNEARHIPSIAQPHQANNNLNNSSRRKNTRGRDDDGLRTHHHPVIRKRPKIIINLHKSRKGYDVAVKNYTKETSDDDEEDDKSSHNPLTAHRVPYSDNDPFLEALNHSSVPPSSVMPSSSSSLYGPGGTICGEVRDYRRFEDQLKKSKESVRVPQRKNILLKPSPTSLEEDFQNILAKSVADSMLYKAKLLDQRGKDYEDSDYEVESDDEGTDEPARLSYDQKLELEKEFINTTAGPVCLDPGRDGSVATLENRRQWEGLKWEGTGKKVPKGRKGPCPRAEEISSPIANSLGAKIQELHRFVQGVKKRRVGTFKDDKEPFKLPQIGNLEYPPMEAPKNIAEEIDKVFANCGIFPLECPGSGLEEPMDYDNDTRKIEEYCFETESTNATKLTIYQKNGIDSHFGELEIESISQSPCSSNNQLLGGNYLTSDNSLNAIKCQFELGSFRNVTLYVRQFRDIFTDAGRKPCKIVITKYGPGYSLPETQTIMTATSPCIPSTSSGSSSSSGAANANTNASDDVININFNLRNCFTTLSSYCAL